MRYEAYGVASRVGAWNAIGHLSFTHSLLVIDFN